MATPVILYDKNGKPLLTHMTPWGNALLTVEPSRVFGWFKSVTNAGEQIQTVVGCSAGQALFVTDIVISANKTAGSTLTVRFYDAATNTVNIYVADTAESTVNVAIHPQGRTIGWNGAYIQLVTDTVQQAATCTVWYTKVKGALALSYAEWNSLRGL